jgi:hypothetical protein
VVHVVESGKVFLPDAAPWLNDYIEEMAAFPTGLYDDAVDSTTQALNYFRDRYSAPPPFLMPGSTRSEEVDKEELWRRAMLGYPMSPSEIERM